MTKSAAIDAALTVLTEALDDADTDIAHSLALLIIDVAAAIPSYRGLSIAVPHSDPPLLVTTLAEGAVADDVHTSLRFTLPSGIDPPNTSEVVIMLYAGAAGTFVDLAADLAWLTTRPPSDFVLDEHASFAAKPVPGTQLQMASAINQAIGALIGRGYTPQQADRRLDAHATHNRTDRYGAAAGQILASITPHDGHLDIP